jgi:hypothetical protein
LYQTELNYIVLVAKCQDRIFHAPIDILRNTTLNNRQRADLPDRDVNEQGRRNTAAIAGHPSEIVRPSISGMITHRRHHKLKYDHFLDALENLIGSLGYDGFWSQSAQGAAVLVGCFSRTLSDKGAAQ